MSPSKSHDTLRAVAVAYATGAQSFQASIRAALDALMDEVQCERVSLWKFQVVQGTRVLRCLLHQHVGSAPVENSELLDEAQYRDYFTALVKEGIYVSNDAASDDRLRKMRADYLDRHRITALLDIPLAINGRAYGIVCCEQLNGPHPWSPAERSAARQTVARAGLLLASEPTIRLELLDSIAIRAF